MENTQVAVSDSAPAQPAAAEASSVKMTSEEKLLEIIDLSDVHLQNDGVPLRHLQRACMRVPHISGLLTGNRRLKLYVQLLLIDEAPIKSRDASSFAAGADKCTAEQKAQAQQLVEVFPDGALSANEAQGFLHRFSARMGYAFSEEQLGVLLALAHVVADAELPSVIEALHILFRLMAVVVKDFLVSNSNRLFEGATSRLLGLLIQYHDPVLSVRCSQSKVDVGAMAMNWSRRLFILDGAYADALPILDWLFILGDPLLIPYIAIAYIISIRQSLIDLEADEMRARWASMTLSLPTTKAEAADPQLADGRSIALVPVWSGKSLLQNADLTYRNTPVSAQRVLELCLNPESSSVNKTPDALDTYYASWPCLPLERIDIASSFAATPDLHAEIPPIEYAIVDCRSKASYDYARLPTAMFVGDVVHYDREKLNELESRIAGSKGTHFAVFGTGRDLVEEINLLKLVALQLVQKGYPYVSIVTGGFKTTIPLIRSQAIRVLMPSATAAAVSTEAGSGDGIKGGLTTALSDLREALGPEADAVKEQASKITAIAKDGLTSAGTWGWNLLQTVQEKISETKTNVQAKQQQQTQQQQQQRHQSPPHAASASSRAKGAPSGEPLQGRVAPPAEQQQQVVFTLGDDEGEDDDDFGLITAVPTRPLKGTLVAPPSTTTTTAQQQQPQAKRASSPDPNEPNNTSQQGKPSQLAAAIDAEFDELFGDAVPSPSPPAAATTNALNTEDVNELFEV